MVHIIRFTDIAMGNTHVRLRIIPAASTNNLKFSTRSTFWVISTRKHVKFMMIPILSPFKYISSHIVNTVGTDPLWKCIDTCWSLRGFITQVIRIKIISPRIKATVVTSGCFFPFRFGWQPSPSPLAVRFLDRQ